MSRTVTETNKILVENIKKRIQAVYKSPQHLAMRLRIEYHQFEKYMALKEQLPAALILKIADELSIDIYSLYGESPSTLEKYTGLSKQQQRIIDRMVDDLRTMPTGSCNSQDDYS